MSDYDININIFSFLFAFDKMKSLQDDLSELSSVLSNLNILDVNHVLSSSLLNQDILELKNIVLYENDKSIYKFINKMEKFKDESLIIIEPNFEYYYKLYNHIYDSFGEDYFLEDYVITPEILNVIYPGFDELSPERKILIYDAIKYANLRRLEAMKNAMNYNDSGRSQFPYHTEWAWCAMFCGGLINYRFGNGEVLGRSYESLYKLVGNFNDQVGIAFSEDSRKQFILSSFSVDFLNNPENSSVLDDWKQELDVYNNNNNTNIQYTDWINEDYKPLSGDLIIFNFNDVEENNLRYPGWSNAFSHVGFVLGVRDINGQLFVDTIEGNVQDSVIIRSFAIDDPVIKGYCHIDYEQYDMISETDEKYALSDEEIMNIANRGIDYSFNNVTFDDLYDGLTNINEN